MMYSKQHIEDQIMGRFSQHQVKRREELWSFVRRLDPQIKEARFNYILLDLKKNGKLRDVGKGVYAIGNKVEFHPATDKIMTNLIDHLKQKESLEGTYGIWTTEWLNEFLELQSTATMYILEVDKLSMDRVFFSLRDKYSFVFSNPDRPVIETYISGLPQAIVIWPLISRAPLDTNRGVAFPTLEKILVDLYCDTDLFFAYQGSQLIHIFEAAFSKYPINFSRLFNYAKRRNRGQELEAFLLKHTNTKTEINSTKK